MYWRLTEFVVDLIFFKVSKRNTSKHGEKPIYILLGWKGTLKYIWSKGKVHYSIHTRVEVFRTIFMVLCLKNNTMLSGNKSDQMLAALMRSDSSALMNKLKARRKKGGA